MNLIKDNMVFLQAVAHLPTKQAKTLLRSADRSQILSIAEIAKNILAKVIKLPDVYKSMLKAHRRLIRDLADQESTYRQREHIIKSKPEVIAQLVHSVLKRLLQLI